MSKVCRSSPRVVCAQRVHSFKARKTCLAVKYDEGTVGVTCKAPSLNRESTGCVPFSFYIKFNRRFLENLTSDRQAQPLSKSWYQADTPFVEGFPNIMPLTLENCSGVFAFACPLTMICTWRSWKRKRVET